MVWFWWLNSLNLLADRDEFNSITCKINGGLNGLEDQLQLWKGEGSAMRLIELMLTQFRLLVLGVLLIALTSASAAAAWRVQDWRYGQQLERQARLQADART